MKIVSIDLGKFKSVVCESGDDREPRFETLSTCREDMRRLLKRTRPDVFVFETSTAAGWLADLCESVSVPYLVANPNGEAWRWSKIKRKTDRDDALKLVRLHPAAACVRSHEGSGERSTGNCRLRRRRPPPSSV